MILLSNKKPVAGVRLVCKWVWFSLGCEGAPEFPCVGYLGFTHRESSVT